MTLFEIYEQAYLATRQKYGHPDKPVLYRGRHYCETLPPKGWGEATYAAYFAEVMRLNGWYAAARKYAALRRKTTADRADYVRACERYAVDDNGVRFEGEPIACLF